MFLKRRKFLGLTLTKLLRACAELANAKMRARHCRFSPGTSNGVGHVSDLQW
jgi:hypothetical protein